MVVPEQMVVAVAVTVATGAVVTETKVVAVSEQPLLSVAVTVYPVGAVGVTTYGFVVLFVFHTYVFPPETRSVALLPEQIVPAPEMLTTGREFTRTFCNVLEEHPCTSVIVTE